MKRLTVISIILGVVMLGCIVGYLIVRQDADRIAIIGLVDKDPGFVSAATSISTSINGNEADCVAIYRDTMPSEAPVDVPDLTIEVHYKLRKYDDGWRIESRNSSAL